MHPGCLHSNSHGRVCHACAAVRDGLDKPWRACTADERESNRVLGGILEQALRAVMNTACTLSVGSWQGSTLSSGRRVWIQLVVEEDKARGNE